MNIKAMQAVPGQGSFHSPKHVSFRVIMTGKRRLLNGSPFPTLDGKRAKWSGSKNLEGGEGVRKKRSGSGKKVPFCSP